MGTKRTEAGIPAKFVTDDGLVDVVLTGDDDAGATTVPVATAAAAPTIGAADYDWSPHYPEGTKLYRHTYPDGQVVAIRRFGDIYSKQWLRSIKHLEIEFDIESAAIDRAACEAARDLIDTRPCPVDGPDDFHELWKAWTSAGSGDDAKAVSAGE